MRKTLSIIFITIFLFGAGQVSTTDSIHLSQKRIVETPKQDTEIGSLKLMATKLENEESLIYQEKELKRIKHKAYK